jgi:hypothetical protein
MLSCPEKPVWQHFEVQAQAKPSRALVAVLLLTGDTVLQITTHA